MTPIDIATEKMLSDKDENIVKLFFTVRQIVVGADTRLVESIKWGMPHFDYNGIMCGVGAFKKHVSIWFHKGDLMSNKLNLFNADSSAKTMGQIKISNLDEIDADGILSYVKEAISINESLPAKKKTAKKSTSKPTKKLIESEGFQNELANNPVAQDFFESMTISQKNGYLEYIEEAKTETTKQKRISRSIERLAKGLKAIY
jgi:uncharacterized protein YdeI (YjbR/CyaY-like superfamily)